MKNITLLPILLLSLLFIGSTNKGDAANVPQSGESGKKILVITVDGAIQPVTAEYVQKSIKKASQGGYGLLVMELDTPGGLDTSMRSIIKEMIHSDVPVVVYVAPSGARAASAGVFITMAASIAAMAPGTNIGAAHPVAVSGEMDKTMAEKATNDAVAYIKSIAEKRGRNVEWAEKAVRKSVSVTDKEALSLKIIDLSADSLDDLLKKINGRTVEANGRKTVITTANAPIERDEAGMRLKVLALISDPNIAYILMMLGFYGLFFELSNPGAIFPGVLGGISLILAFYSFQTLPVNYAGLMLIILGIIMFILEVKIVSHGILTIGGIIAMTIGSLMLFDSSSPFVQLSLQLVIFTVLLTAAFFTIVIGLAYKAFKKKAITGKEGLIGSEGIAKTDITPGKEGMIQAHGELWRAVSSDFIEKDAAVTILSLNGLTANVRKKVQNA